MYDFTKKAICCETWEQMQELAKIAEAQDRKIRPDLFNESDFNGGFNLFAVSKAHIYNLLVPSDGDTTITYSDFIASAIPPPLTC